MISIAHLSKRYGAQLAVDDLTLEIPSGVVFGLLGPNGSGKTTTFKGMLGLLRASGGEVRFDGAPLVPAAFEQLAYVPEKSVLYEWMTVAEHIEATKRSFASFDAARAVELLGCFGVDPKKSVRALSKGMKTATQVALAFARSPRILILDEPTTGLDPINQRSVLNLIVETAANGATIIFSSHQVGQVERTAERIAILKQGRLVLEGVVDDLKTQRKIVEGVVEESFSLNGLANDVRIDHIERSGRILRLHCNDGADALAQTLGSSGAIGIRVLDLGLEDIFFTAVSEAE